MDKDIPLWQPIDTAPKDGTMIWVRGASAIVFDMGRIQRHFHILLDREMRCQFMREYDRHYVNGTMIKTKFVGFVPIMQGNCILADPQEWRPIDGANP